MQRKNSDDLVLLFQINRTTSVIIYIAIISLGILLMATGLYFLVVLPAKFLYFVAKGRVFTDETIGMLYVISCFLILLGLIPGIVRCIFHLIFKSQIPDEVRFSFFEAIMSTSGFLIAGLITLLLAKAFLKGSQILKEQELTV